MDYELPHGELPHYKLPKGPKLPVVIYGKHDFNEPAPESQYDLIAQLVAEKLGVIRDYSNPQRKIVYSGSVTTQELKQLQNPKYLWYGRVPTSQFIARVNQPNHRLQWKWSDDGEYINLAGLTFWLRVMEDIGSYRPIYAELYFLSTGGWKRLRRDQAGLFGETANVRACHEQLRLHAEMLIELGAVAAEPDAIEVAVAAE